jgi:hypothetical protein
MGAAIWSAPPGRILEFPAENFVAFFNNHRLLQYDRPVWRSVKGGSRRYVEKLVAGFGGQLRLGCAVTSIARTSCGVIIQDSHGRRDAFDHVVMASHSDQTLAMLSDASSDEHAILGDIGYAPNVVYLHRDKRLMPKRRHAWASWNFLRWQRQGTTGSGTAAPLGSGGAAPWGSGGAAPFNDVAVTYWMNALQGIDEKKPLFVSLNPPFAPDPALTFGRYTCDHPQYTPAAFAAQKRLGDIQGRRHTWFCGAWTGYGFHEDGLRSGLAVAQSLGASVPWRAPPPELAQAAE